MEFMDVAALKQKLNVLCVLDEALTPPENDWLRLVSYEKTEAEECYIIDNGSGDSLMVWFTELGAFVKGFDHESDLNQFAADDWDAEFFEKMFEGAPEEVVESLTEEDYDETTFFMWYLKETGEWYQNEVEGNDGGKSFLLDYLPKSAETLLEWAQSYYDKDLNEEVVTKLFETGKLSESDKAKLVK